MCNYVYIYISHWILLYSHEIDGISDSISESGMSPAWTLAAPSCVFHLGDGTPSQEMEVSIEMDDY